MEKSTVKEKVKLNNNNNNLENNLSSISDDLKTFVKIKKVNVPEDKQYIKISKDKAKINFIDNSKRTELEKSVIFENNKVFAEEENSYIFEEVCRESVKEFIGGQNFCYFGYGLTHSGKMGALFGGNDCENNINNRGLIFRFLESLKLNLNSLISSKGKDQFSVSYSFICINANKYADLLSIQKLINESELNLFKFTEAEMSAFFRDYKATVDISSILIKHQISLSDSDNFDNITGISINSIISYFVKLRSIFYKLEFTEKKFYSKSHFCFFVYLTNLKTNKTSTCAFTVLAGSEKSSNSSGSPVISKTRDCIYIQNSFSTLLSIVSMLKSPEFKQEKFNEIPFDDSTLTYCLKSFLGNAKIKILATLVPNIGYQDSVRDVLMFLFKFRKGVFGKDYSSAYNKTLADKNDEILYELENKIKSKEREIQRLTEQTNNLNKRLEDSDLSNKRNLEAIKSAFNFEGDLNKLSSNDDSLPEVKYARNVRDALDQNRILNKRIKEFEKKVSDLKEEIKKVNTEKRLIENDRVAIANHIKVREENLHEENKIKILCENSKELDELKKKNEILEKQISEYRKIVEENGKKIQSLPNILKENIEERKEIAKKREELKGQFDKNMKTQTKTLEKKYCIEIESNTLKFQNEINHKDEMLKKLSDDHLKLKKAFDDDYAKLTNEFNCFYDLINPIAEHYKRELEPLISKLMNYLFNPVSQVPYKVTNNFFNSNNNNSNSASLQKQRISSARINSNSNTMPFNSQNDRIIVNPDSISNNGGTYTNLIINLKNSKIFFDKLLESYNLKLNRYNYPSLFSHIDNVNFLKLKQGNINASNANTPASAGIQASRTGNLFDLLKNTSKFTYINSPDKEPCENKEKLKNTKQANKKALEAANAIDAISNAKSKANEIDIFLEMNTQNMQSEKGINNKNNLSISASDISREMEKADSIRSFHFEEVEKMQPHIVLKLLNDQYKKVKELELFFDEVKKEKRGYHKFTKESKCDFLKQEANIENISKEKFIEYIKKLERQNEKLNKKIENLMQINFALKMKKEPFANKLFQNVSASNLGFNLNNNSNHNNRNGFASSNGFGASNNVNNNLETNNKLKESSENNFGQRNSNANLLSQKRPFSSNGKTNIKN